MADNTQENEKEVKPMFKKTYTVTKELWKRVQHKCIDAEISATEAVRRLLIKWVNGDIDI